MSAIFLFSHLLGSRDRLRFRKLTLHNISIAARFFLFLARCDRFQLELRMPDLPDSIAEITENCSSNDDILVVISNLDADLQSLGACSPVVSTDSEVMFISPPTSPLMLLPNQISNDEPVSPDSTSTIEVSDNDPAVEASSTAGVQFIADDTNEYQHELPPASSFPTDCSPLLSRPSHFKHRAGTANSVHSRQHCNDSFASKPTAIIRPRIDSRHRYVLKPEINSWEIVFWDNQRKQLTIQNTALSTQCISVPPGSCHWPSSFRTLNSLEILSFSNSTQSLLSFLLSPRINFCSPWAGWVIELRLTLKP